MVRGIWEMGNGKRLWVMRRLIFLDRQDSLSVVPSASLHKVQPKPRPRASRTRAVPSAHVTTLFVGLSGMNH
ncbi:hypothetical protein G7K_1714-t1 [Saitoella complicata NRRL Y-17804]|uniref:Uncharacterized protein n=1 Tax=Saitoella complicata (strain BCRC 22490 / CBS 7301 / JCM 7358 / NBRC 10748 / NRRL Y-17804) TaxID=698492 RepID=A0A0E9NCE6_SAICN|nr:hypothetical protein G7K_1714-t1 [Saitoella complicata NRRL Y-17804]